MKLEIQTPEELEAARAAIEELRSSRSPFVCVHGYLRGCYCPLCAKLAAFRHFAERVLMEVPNLRISEHGSKLLSDPDPGAALLRELEELRARLTVARQALNSARVALEGAT